MTHRTHNTIVTDASSYDERCLRCGATDRWVPEFAGTMLDKPCPKSREKRLLCPKEPKHKIFVADVVLKGKILVSPEGQILNLVIGPDAYDLTITEYNPELCGVCHTRLTEEVANDHA